MCNPTEGPATIPSADLADASRFVAASGFVVEEATATRLTGHVDLGSDHHTPWGVVHGGVYTTIVETAASAAASVAVADRGQFAVGVHNATDFLRPTTGCRASVVAEPLQQGRIQQLWQVVITDTTTAKVLARGQLRLQNVHCRAERTRVTDQGANSPILIIRRWRDTLRIERLRSVPGPGDRSGHRPDRRIAKDQRFARAKTTPRHLEGVTSRPTGCHRSDSCTALRPVTHFSIPIL